MTPTPSTPYRFAKAGILKPVSGELEFIRSLRKFAGGGSRTVRLGIGDDCAVLRPPRGHDICVTTDFSLEGRHFRRDWHPAASAGHRCLARGLSDLAAMGARPMAAFLSLALPAGCTRKAAGRAWLDGFLGGLLALASETKTPLAGGDTSTAPGQHILADIILMGSLPRGTELRRSGAKAGDALYVTGALGGAAAELEQLAQTPRRFRKASTDNPHPHLYPVPRLVAGERLRSLASAAIDVSDGLSTDLQHLCEESGLGAVVDAAALPLHPFLKGLPETDALHHALHGGEDYELLFTAPSNRHIPKQIGGVPITRIGTMKRAPGIVLRTSGGECALIPGGWEHSL